jgi:hypothetical protein
MNAIVPIVAVIALLAVLAVLMTGVVGMAKGGDFNRKYGNVLMRWRVGLQGAAILLILIALMLSRD